MFASMVFFLLGGGYGVDASTLDLWLVSGLNAELGFVPLPAALVGPVVAALVSVRLVRRRGLSTLEHRLYPAKAGVAAAVALGLLAALVGRVRTDVADMPVSFGTQPVRVFVYCLFAFGFAALIALNVDRQRVRSASAKANGRDAALFDALNAYGLAVAAAMVLGTGWWLLSDFSVGSIVGVIFTLLLVSVTLASSAVAFAGFGSMSVSDWQIEESVWILSDGVPGWFLLGPLALGACAAAVGYRRSRFTRPASFEAIARGAALQAALFSAVALTASLVTHLSLSAESWGGEYYVSESIEVAFTPISVILGSFLVSFAGFVAGGFLWARAAGLVAMPNVTLATVDRLRTAPATGAGTSDPVGPPAHATDVCSRCGSTVDDGDRFCTACGASRVSNPTG